MYKWKEVPMFVVCFHTLLLHIYSIATKFSFNSEDPRDFSLHQFDIISISICQLTQFTCWLSVGSEHRKINSERLALYSMSIFKYVLSLLSTVFQADRNGQASGVSVTTMFVAIGQSHLCWIWSVRRYWKKNRFIQTSISKETHNPEPPPHTPSTPPPVWSHER